MKRRDTQNEGRNTRLHFLVWILCPAVCGMLLAAGASRIQAQDGSRLIKPADVVKSQVYVSIDPVPRGKRFDIAVVGEVAAGYHVQASKVLEDYLIPFKLTPDLPLGFTLVNTDYPRAQMKKFPFGAKPMAVYEGKLLVRMTLEAGADAALGPLKIPLSLRYQACNDQLCLPPVKVPLNAEFIVAAAGAASQKVHPEIFAIRE